MTTRPPDRPTVVASLEDQPASAHAIGDVDLTTLMARVTQGDEDAFAALYDAVASNVYGLVLRVLRDPAQSQEVAQEVMVEVWQQAARFDPARGSVKAFVLPLAHRRAVDRVRSAQAASARELRVGQSSVERDYDSVSEQVVRTLEAEEVRRALGLLSDLQREAVELAYYGGRTHREVADLLDVPLGTVKTRLRDGLIRLRAEMGVA